MCPEKGNEAVKVLEHKSDGEQLRYLGLNRRLREDLITLYIDLKGGSSKVGVSLFSQATVIGQKEMASNWFRLAIRKNFLSERVGLPMVAVESLS